MRVDWFTPDGLPTWGDGRFTILGTEGTIELRKYVDIAGRPGTDHLFVADRKGTRHIDCSKEPLTYFRHFAADVRDRTETAMTQAHVFTVCRLALEAQARAQRVGAAPRSATEREARLLGAQQEKLEDVAQERRLRRVFGPRRRDADARDHDLVRLNRDRPEREANSGVNGVR